LAGAGGILIDEDDQRHSPRSDRLAAVIEILARAAAAGGHDQAVIDEAIGYLDGCFQKPARIAAQIDDELPHPLLVQLPEGRIDVTGGRLLEAGEFEIADAVLRIDDFDLLDAGNFDAAASELHVLQRAVAFA